MATYTEDRSEELSSVVVDKYYYRDELSANGMKISGLSPDGRIVEMIEIPEHPWFLATQAHPELKSRPNRPHPLFRGFIEAALEYAKQNQAVTGQFLNRI